MKTHVCLLVIASLFLFECNGVKFMYPLNSQSPCIMVNMNANLSLTMTGGKTPFKTDSTLAGAVSSTGECDATAPSVDVTLSPGSGLKGQMTLAFSKGTDSKVNMDVTFTFSPADVFKNKDTTPKTITEDGSTALSKDTSSYTCSSDQEIKFSPVKANNFTYQLKMTISDVQIQAFNLQNGTFSKAEDCSSLADVTTEGPSTQPPAAPTTQPPAAPTTQNTTGNQTTEPPAAQTTQPPSNDTSTAGPGTTMPPKNESTSEAPTTKAGTTMAPTTMAPEPTTPKPGSPDTQTYKASGVNGTCVMIKAGIEFKIPYMSKSKVNKTAIIGIPSGNGTTVKGNCMGPNNTQSVTVTFYNDWDLMLTFAESSDSEFYLSDANLVANLNSEIISDIAAPVTRTVNKVFGKDQFKAAKDGSYKCNDETTVKVGDGFEMNTYNLQYAAFQTNITAFTDSGVSECSSDTSTNSVVPIAVGAALAGLVVIVLIAYLIGRKRSRQSGYEQV